MIVVNAHDEALDTNQEPHIYYKNPAAALAAAVIRQWKIDGCPKSSENEIKMWQSIYNEAVTLKQ